VLAYESNRVLSSTNRTSRKARSHSSFVTVRSFLFVIAIISLALLCSEMSYNVYSISALTMSWNLAERPQSSVVKTVVGSNPEKMQFRSI